jgi:hypothetical protein
MAKNQNNYARYASMGTMMIVTIGLGTFAGVKIDRWLEIKFPIFTLILSIFSVFTAIYLAIKDFLKKK